MPPSLSHSALIVGASRGLGLAPAQEHWNGDVAWSARVRGRASPHDLPDRSGRRLDRLRPRHVVPKPAQTYEPEVPVEVREWIAPAPSSPDFVLEAQPPAQPHRRVSIERPIRLADGSYLEVVRQTADARNRITTRSRPSLTTARELSTYAAGFGERPFLCAPAFPPV